MIDILLPIYNNLSYTKIFIDSLTKQSTQDFRLIVIDNGSTDSSELFFKDIITTFEIKIIKNKHNLGYVKAINQGLVESKEDLILFANNDTILSTNLLEQMSKFIGTYDILSPYSNCIDKTKKNELLIEYDGNPNIMEINSFAKDLYNSKSKEASIITVDYVFGHCMLLSRKVYKAIGGLDEDFGIGNYDDIDYCKRAKKNGFSIGLYKRGFVYHFCHSTFKEIGIDIDKLILDNKNIFDKKWS